MTARRVHALAPHLLRWEMPGLLLFGAWAVVAPLLLAHEAGGVSLLWQAGASAQVQAARWLLIVMLPALAGLEVHAATAPLLSTPAGWLLPGVRRRLLTATALVAVPLLLGAAFLAGLSAAGASTAAILAHALSGIGIGLLSFAVGAVMSDGAVPRMLRWPPAILLIAAVVQPGRSLALLNAEPLVVGALAAMLAAVLLQRQWAPATGRARALSAPTMGGGFGLSDSRHAPGAGSAGGLQAGHLVPWLRAAAAEGRGAPLALVATGGIAAVAGHVLDMPAMVLVLAGSAFTSRGTHLAGGLVYPLHRRRRARLAFAGTALDAVTYCGVAGVIAAALQVLGVPYWAGEATSVGWVPSLALTLALAPVAQWGAVRRAAEGTGFRDLSSLRSFRPMLWFVLLAVGLLAAIRFTGAGDDASVLLPAILVVAGVCWTLNWLAIRRLYSEGDLLIATLSS